MADIPEIDNNELAALDGLSLAEALESFILALAHNPEFAAEIRKCIPTRFDFGGEEGWLADKLWNVRNPELAKEYSERSMKSWLNQRGEPAKPTGIELSDLEKTILAQIEHNIVQLHEWLAQGVLESTGRLDEVSGDRETIAPDVWTRKIRINLEKGDLFSRRLRGEIGALWRLRYANIKLCVPVVEPTNTADELPDKRLDDAPKTQHTGGKHAHPWNEAFDLFVIRLGVGKNAGGIGHPEDRSALREEIQVCFQEIGHPKTPDDGQINRWFRNNHKNYWIWIASEQNLH